MTGESRASSTQGVQSAVRLDTHPCPVCSTPAAHPKIRSQVVIEDGRDVDLRPKTYKWLVKDVERVQPLLYFVWQCPACSFAAANPMWSEPWKGTAYNQVRFQNTMMDKLANLPQVSGVVRKLSLQPGAERDHLSVIGVTALSLFLALQFEDFIKSESMVPGRYCVRIAWLMREISQDPKLKARFAGPLEQMLGSVRSEWPDVPQTEEAFRKKAIEYYTHALTNSRSIETARDEVEMMLLIGRLYMTIGKMKDARVFLDRGRSSTKKFEEEKKAAQTKGETPELQKMTQDLRLLERMNDDLRNIFDDIRDEVREAQRLVADPILAANKGKSPEQLRELLTRGGVEPEFALEFAPNKKEEKKGLLGSLFG